MKNKLINILTLALISSTILLTSFIPVVSAQNLSDIISNITSDPITLTVFLAQIVIGFGIGYCTAKALRYVLAIVALLIISLMLSFWQFGSMQEFLMALGVSWNNILSVIQSMLNIVGIFTALPMGLGFCIGIVIGAIKKK